MCLIAKFREKVKMPKFGTKKAFTFLRTIVFFEISNLDFVKHESLADTMNFVVGSAFSKGLGSTFS